MDIPNILKQRKQLAKLVLDYDSARARFVRAFNKTESLRTCSLQIFTLSFSITEVVLSHFFLPPTFTCLSQLRWLQATKSIFSGTNTQALTAKADLLKEEMDEAMNKMELCKVKWNAAHLYMKTFSWLWFGSRRVTGECLQRWFKRNSHVACALCPSPLMHTEDWKCPVSVVRLSICWAESLVKFSVQ